MLQQSSSTPGAAGSASSKLNTQGADPNIAKMIQGHIKGLKNRDVGIRRALHNTYGMTEREMNSVSVDVRSGFEQDAYDALLAAWKAKQELVAVQ